jgi:hypothetical protein
VKNENRRRERWLALGIAVALTVLRSIVLTAFEGSHFDSDQALLGLMAKHIIEGRAFPLFVYGHTYLLGVEAWMAVPTFLIGGVTVPMLILPLAILNVAVSVLLVIGLERAAGLRPLLALVPALLFIAVPPGTAAAFLEANGSNVEPFLYALVLWRLRRWPLAFGALLAFSVLHREFIIYAFTALVILWLFDRGWRQTNIWRRAAVGGLGFAAVWETVYVLKQFSSVDGPGTTMLTAAANGNVAAVASHACVDLSTLPVAAWRLWNVHLPALLGAAERPLTDFGINSTQAQGANWLGPLLAIAVGILVARLIWLLVRERGRVVTASLAFPTYLLLIGVQSLGAYGVFKCGVVGIGTMRYGLLGLAAPIGLVAVYLICEQRRAWQAIAIAATLAVAGVSAADHARLAAEYMFHTPINPRRIVADYLVSHGHRFARAGFWNAYSVTFLAKEKVIVASTDVVFIREYQWLVADDPDSAVSIQPDPCAKGSRVAGLYVCRP